MGRGVEGVWSTDVCICRIFGSVQAIGFRHPQPYISPYIMDIDTKMRTLPIFRRKITPPLHYSPLLLLHPSPLYPSTFYLTTFLIYLEHTFP